MVAINFMSQFAEDVEYGDKTQTIRQKARCKVGDELQLYTAQRTPQCRKLGDAICTDVIPVHIEDCGMSLNGVQLYAGDALRGEYEDRDNDFAKKDGFDGFSEMADFFRAQYGLPFDGYVIKWRLL